MLFRSGQGGYGIQTSPAWSALAARLLRAAGQAQEMPPIMPKELEEIFARTAALDVTAYAPARFR